MNTLTEDEQSALLPAFQKLDHILGRENEGVRIMAPTGELGYVPEENLAEALAAGARVMTPEDMRSMNEQIDGQHRDPAAVVREFRARKGF